jgi:hypothetical protein
MHRSKTTFWRAPRLALGITLIFLAGCSPGSPQLPARRAPAVPPIFEQACQLEGRSVCTAVASGAVSARLIRPLHFPPAAAARCPASPARYVSTPDFGSTEVGRGLVRVGVDNLIIDGIVHPAPAGSAGWLALKTHFVSVPAYQGPFLVRVKRLGHPGPVRLGPTPAQAGPYLALGGRAYDDPGGWRDAPDPTFVKAPGCYGWQVDGLTFSEIIVVRVGQKVHFRAGD